MFDPTITVSLPIFEEDALAMAPYCINQLDTTTVILSSEQVEGLLDSVSRLLFAHRAGWPVEGELDDLDEIMVAINCMGEKN